MFKILGCLEVIKTDSLIKKEKTVSLILQFFNSTIFKILGCVKVIKTATNFILFCPLWLRIKLYIAYCITIFKISGCLEIIKTELNSRLEVIFN